MNRKKVNEDMIRVLASSGLYDAILPDGSKVDFRSWMIAKGLFEPRSSGLGSFWKELQREFRDGIDMLVHKPLKVLPYVASLGAVGAFGGGAQSAITGALSGISGQAASLIKSSSWTDLQRLVRNSLQTTGVIPTNDQVSAAMQMLVDQTVYGDYTAGEPIVLDPQNIEWPRTTKQYYTMDDLMEYAPWAAAAGLALILLLRK